MRVRHQANFVIIKNFTIPGWSTVLFKPIIVLECQSIFSDTSISEIKSMHENIGAILFLVFKAI